MYRRKRKEPLRRISEVLKVAATSSPTVFRSARLRMKNLSTIADDKAAFQAQSQYKTLYQFIFNDEYDKLRG